MQLSTSKSIFCCACFDKCSPSSITCLDLTLSRANKPAEFSSGASGIELRVPNARPPRRWAGNYRRQCRGQVYYPSLEGTMIQFYHFSKYQILAFWEIQVRWMTVFSLMPNRYDSTPEQYEQALHAEPYPPHDTSGFLSETDSSRRIVHNRSSNYQ